MPEAKYINPKLEKFAELFQGKRVVVMGLGVHGGGLGAAKFFAEIGAQVIATDTKSSSELSSSLAELSAFKNIQYALGGHRKKDFQEADLIIKNPGVPDDSLFLNIARENKVAIDTDIGIFFNLSPAPIIGITGTKGKSTTATLTAELLKFRYPVVLAGNIRISALEVLHDITPDHWVVLELSSWQLEGLARHRKSPKIAVITNIGQDHLNRYSSFEDYVKAKKLIFNYQTNEDLLILNADCPDLREFPKEAESKVYFYGKDLTKMPSYAHGATIKDDWFIWQKEQVAPVEALELRGDHNLQNSLAAITVAKLLDIPNESIREKLGDFKPLSGRLEIVKNINGVVFINDTTATTPMATLKAIQSLSNPVILIAGGADKNLSYDELTEAIQKTVKAVILLPGTATEKIKSRLKDVLSKKTTDEKTAWYESENMEEAVSVAWRIAEQGDIILLSPAAASFGLFAHEFERGDAFVKSVNELYSRHRKEYTFKKESSTKKMTTNQHNTDWELWKKKFGGRYLGHVSRTFSYLLKKKMDLIPLDISVLPRVFYSVAKIETAPEPKQVIYHPKYNIAIVSCMEGRKVQLFNCNQNNLKLIDEVSFKHQCVEVNVLNNLCFVTLSAFSHIPGTTDSLAIIDIESRKILSQVNTGGSWSKVIKAHPSGLIFVSNWRSNNLSIIDIFDPLRPKVIQLLPCGISPRGIAFTKFGELGLVTGFYSRNIIEIRQKNPKLFEVSFIGNPYDFPNYSGSMRDVIIDPANNEYAYISNLGRNLIHIYHIPTRNIIDSILVGEHPNSIAFFDSFKKKKMIISCRESNAVCLLDVDTRKVEGCTEPKIKKSTGLHSFPGGFLVTHFAENLLELYKITSDQPK